MNKRSKNRDRGLKMRRHGFSLLEVLIAVAILFVVSSAIIALSNSLLQGTVAVADRTVVNRLTAEGLEITTKIRDENYLRGGASGLWLSQAENPNKYGWYKLAVRDIGGEPKTWEFSTPYPLVRGAISLSEAFELGDKVTEGNLIASRLICIEAIAAEPSDVDELRCNIMDQSLIDDGNRSMLLDCDNQRDLYCAMTKLSLNRHRVGSATVIPAGNVVKTKAVVIWKDKATYRFAEAVTMLTNWRSVVEN